MIKLRTGHVDLGGIHRPWEEGLSTFFWVLFESQQLVVSCYMWQAVKPPLQIQPVDCGKTLTACRASQQCNCNAMEWLVHKWILYKMLSCNEIKLFNAIYKSDKVIQYCIIGWVYYRMLWNHLSTLHNAMEATVTIRFCRSAIFGYGPKSGIADVVCKHSSPKHMVWCHGDQRSRARGMTAWLVLKGKVPQGQWRGQDPQSRVRVPKVLTC